MWQVYQKLYYQTKLKPVVDAAYEEFLENYKPISEEGDNGDGKMKNARLQIQNRVVRDMYEKESSEVKAEVEKHREELKKQGDGGIYSEPEKLQK